MIFRILLGLIGLGVTTDAGAVFSKWSTRTSAAQQDYVNGVQNTTKDPTQLAINNQARAVSNYTAALQSGKWATRLRNVGKTGWQQAVAAKASNFSTGVQNAETKFVGAFTRLLAFENTLQSQVDAMPNVTDTDRENRMLAWVRGMRQYQG